MEVDWFAIAPTIEASVALGRLWHVGLIVDDLDRVMDRFAAAYGLHWVPRRSVDRTQVVFSSDPPLSLS